MAAKTEVQQRLRDFLLGCGIGEEGLVENGHGLGVRNNGFREDPVVLHVTAQKIKPPHLQKMVPHPDRERDVFCEVVKDERGKRLTGARPLEEMPSVGKQIMRASSKDKRPVFFSSRETLGAVKFLPLGWVVFRPHREGLQKAEERAHELSHRAAEYSRSSEPKPA